MRIPGIRHFGVAPLLLGAVVVGAAAFTQWSPTDAGSRHEKYTADLVALNPNAGPGPVDGSANLMVQNDTIRINLNGRNIEPNIAHAMHIHSAASCPDASDDVNEDGFVDVIEGLPDYGPILVPLDSDLSSQAAGSFPEATNGGALHYHEDEHYAALLADLMADDPNPGDAVIKLAPGEALNLAGRHIVVHGVSASVDLPDSVATLPGLPAQATLPIACGEIVAK